MAFPALYADQQTFVKYSRSKNFSAEISVFSIFVWINKRGKPTKKKRKGKRWGKYGNGKVNNGKNTNSFRSADSKVCDTAFSIA